MRSKALSLSIGRLLAGILVTAVTPSALAGPNLVANGDLNRPAKEAEMRVNLLKDGVYFAFRGADHFGRVVVTGTDDWRAYRDMVVGYRELGLAGTGGLRGLVVSTADVDIPDVPGTAYIWFDLRGKVRPNRTYEYEFQGFGGGQKRDEGMKVTVIAPALWVDGKPTGAEFDVTFGGGLSPKKGRIRTGDFGKQTGAAGLVFKLPEDMSNGLLLRRVVFREVDEALVDEGKMEMPVPVRYIPIADSVERRVKEVLARASDLLKRFYIEEVGIFVIQGRGMPGTSPQAEAGLILDTANVTTALAAMGQNTRSEPISKCLDWLADPDRKPELEPRQTGVVASRLFCLARYGDVKKHGKAIARDIEWLREAQRADGGWSATSPEDDPEGGPAIRSDNENSALAVEALREAHFAGKPTDRKLWIDAAEYWVNAALLNGGFGASLPEYGGLGELPTLMRTATGMSALLATLDMAQCVGARSCEQYRANSEQLAKMGDSWAWLNANYFFADDHGFRDYLTLKLDQLVDEGNNPMTQAFYLMRLSQVTGRDTLGGHNIAHTEAKRILDFYDRASGTFAGNLAFTGLGLAVLAGVDSPAIIQRIIVGGDNIAVLKRDAEHLARYISKQRRRAYNWREINIQRPMELMAKVPILYLSVEGMPIGWTDADWAKLREYCFAGGVIVVSISDKSGVRKEIEAKLDALFPEYKLAVLPADVPLFPTLPDTEDDKEADDADAADDDDTDDLGLPPEERPKVIGNGQKNFVFVTPSDWSCIWQGYDLETSAGMFRFVDRLLAYTMDGSRVPGAYDPSPYAPGIRGSRTIQVAHMECGGSIPVYPDFVQSISRLMQFNYRVNVEPAEPGSSSDPPVLLWVTGAGTASLTDDERDRIRKAIEAGTYVFLDIAGGEEGSAEAMEAEIKKIDPKLQIRRMPSLHPIYTGNVKGTQGFDVRRVALRRALWRKQFAEVDQRNIRHGRCPIMRIMRGDEEVGAFCKQDVCSGVGDIKFTGARGPVPFHARALAMNIVLRAMEHQVQQKGPNRLTAER